ncbi:thiamine phosphate synthase [Lacticaseibacillus sp. GG6-2]
MLKEALKLYAVTDRHWLNGRTLEACVQQALAGGVTMLQLREKNLTTEAFIQEARRIKPLCQAAHVPFIIDDNVEVALAVDADGVHVGQDDRDAASVRRLIGPDKILGVSAQTVPEAVQAQAAGADYLGVGAVFATATKPDAVDVPLATLQAITAAVTIPTVAIGGIHPGNLMQLRDTGIAGVALVSEIFAATDIQANAKTLNRQVTAMLA